MNHSSYILGTVQFGIPYGINNAKGKPTKEVVFDMLQFAYDNGIRRLDTAQAYGNAQILIGEFIEQTGKHFEINTKFHINSDNSIQLQLEHTLDELKSNQIHTYFYHRYNDLETAPEVVEQLNSLKSEGKIRKIGVSVYTNEEFENCIALNQLDVIQFPFNILDNFSKRGRLIEKAKNRGKELQVRSVFLQGLFFKEKSGFPEKLKPLDKYLSQLRSLANKHNLSMYDLALGYVLSKQELNGVIIGVDCKDQLAQNINVQKIALNQSLIQAIDEIEVQEENLLFPYNW